MRKTSIIIPACNQGQFLAQAITTSLEQIGAEVEVVVINDGSTDNTAEVAAPFAGRREFKYIEQPNRGLPNARNRGVWESTGEHLCFLDADDYYAPEKVRKQAEVLEEDPGVGFVYCDIITVDEQGRPLPEQYSVGDGQRELSGNIFRSLMLGGYFPPHTVMIRRSVLEEVGMFDAELGGHADYDLWLRVSGAGHRACYLDERLAYYRNSPNSMSKDGLRMAETRQAAFRKIVRLYPEAAAGAIESLQQSCRDLFEANRWLQRELQNIGQQYGQTCWQYENTRREYEKLKEEKERSEQFLAEAKPSLWLQRSFQKTLHAKLRRSLRKRLAKLMRCFEEAEGQV